MSSPTEHLLVLCTCPDADTAADLGARLVEERLAACVNVVPGLLSIYSWQGAIARDPEALMLIKTTAARFSDLSVRLRELHPYDLPEIIAHPITAGLPDYLSWVTACTQPQD